MNGVSKKKNKFLMLLKNDFLASSRVISLFYIALALLYALFGICTALAKADSFSFEAMNKISNVHTASIAISMLVSFLLIFVTFFFVVYDFSKSLFGQQGYLSFTLPVSSNQILGSKVVVYGGWLFISYAMFMFTVYFMGTYTIDNIVGQDKVSMLESLMVLLGDFPSITQLVAYLVYVTVMFFVAIFSFVFIVYFAISLAHIRQLQKYSLIASVPIFFALAIAFIAIAAKASDLLNIFLLFNDDHTISISILRDGMIINSQYMIMPITPIIAFVILDIGMFFATSYVMHKKVNLK